MFNNASSKISEIFGKTQCSSTSKVAGINEDTLSTFSSDVEEYVKKIDRILVDLDSVMEKAKKYYYGESSDALWTYYNNLKEDFSIFTKSILSYSVDFTKVIDNWHKTEDIVVKDISQAELRMSTKIDDWRSV